MEWPGMGLIFTFTIKQCNELRGTISSFKEHKKGDILPP